MKAESLSLYNPACGSRLPTASTWSGGKYANHPEFCLKRDVSGSFWRRQTSDTQQEYSEEKYLGKCAEKKTKT